jgi:hypothetical protein
MGAYTKIKKDVLIIFRNKPLLFVDGPPVFIKIAITVEESTSVFILNEGEVEETSEEVQEESRLALAVHPSVIRRISYLGSPFPRQVYRPLQFVLDDETLTGTIEKIEGETVLIETTEGEKEIIAIDMRRIEEILWRGDPFLED